MQMTAFLLPQALPSLTTSHAEPNRCVTRCSGKGFAPPPKQNQPPQKRSRPPEVEPGVDGNYVPRGPTLREEFERRGRIAPTKSADAGVLPEIVADRMLRRILTFGGIPLGLLFTFFGVYFVLKYKYDVTVLPAVVAYTTLGTIAIATLGITYGIFSSSWDEDIEGTKLGWKEARINFVRAKDGLLGARQREIQEDELDRIDQIDD